MEETIVQTLTVDGVKEKLQYIIDEITTNTNHSRLKVRLSMACISASLAMLILKSKLTDSERVSLVESARMVQMLVRDSCEIRWLKASGRQEDEEEHGHA